MDGRGRRRPIVTPRGMVSELKRELRMRHQVYPRLVARHSMTASAAEWQIAALEAVLAEIDGRFADELSPPPDLFAAV